MRIVSRAGDACPELAKAARARYRAAMDPARPKRVLITGASSGIGAALAREYAASGTTLYLGGRNAERLWAVADSCRTLGAVAHTRIQDVTDGPAMAAWVRDAFEEAPVDLVIANAGISGGTGGRGGEAAVPSEDEAQVRRIFAVNLDGVINTVFPAIDAMRACPVGDQGVRGQIAVMSSLAGFRGLPGAPAYSASKAAVRSLGEGLRGLLARSGIAVSVICPGFIRSPMTDINPYPMPFIMSSERAARIIRRGLARSRARIAFPVRLYMLVWLLAALPPAWTDPMFRRFPEKPAGDRVPPGD